MKKRVKMSDIAKKLNVSNVTVSKALADKEGVSDELRSKIKHLASEMGYTYNSVAKSLKDGRTYNIGILVPERFIGLKTSFYWVLYQNISNELIDKNYYGIFESLKQEDERDLVYPKLIQDRKVDGVIILGQASRDYVRKMMTCGTPVICMDFYENIPGIDAVVTDNFYGTYLLTDYLVENGHRDIGFIGNIRATSSIQDRFLGYMKSLIENGLPYRQEWTISDREENGTLIDIELPAQMPSAFVCNCDESACRLVKALSLRGYSVPEDISVVGFDNYLMAGSGEVPITTVEVDMKAMAQTGVEMILQKINHGAFKAGMRLISGRIIIRESVKKIN